MDNAPQAAAGRSAAECPRCKTAHPPDDRFCRNCGLELRDDAAAIETYLARVIPERIDTTLRTRFKDQKIVEVETAEKLAERAMGWLKLFGFFIGIPTLIFGAALSFLGLKTYSDLDAAAKKAEKFQEVVGGAEKQFVGVQKKVDVIDAALKEAQIQLDKQISQINSQQRRLQAQVNSIQDRLRFCPSKSFSSKLQDMLQSQLVDFIRHLEEIGFQNLEEQVSVCIFSKEDPVEKLDARVNDTRNAFYVPEDRAIYIHRDLSAVPSVVLREYTHHALAKAATAPMARHEIESALADYFAANFLGSPLIGETLGPLFQMPTSYIRNLANNKKYSMVDPEFHHRGEVWSAALWTCRQQLGRDVVDKISRRAWTGLTADDTPEIVRKFGSALVKEEIVAMGRPSGCLDVQMRERELPH